MGIDPLVSGVPSSRNIELNLGTSAPRRKLAEATALSRLAPILGKRSKRTKLSLWAFFADLICISAGYIVSSFIRLDVLHVEQVSRILVSILPIYLGVALNNQAHQAIALLDGFKSAWRASAALALAAVALLLIAFFMKIGSEFSRLLFGFGTVLSLLFLVGWRNFLANMGRRYLGASPFATLCIYDDVPRTERSGEGAIDAMELGLSPDPKDPAVIASLSRFVVGMDSIVVHCSPEKRLQWAFLLKALDIPAELVTPELTDLQPLAVQIRSGQASLVIGGGSLAWNQRFLKRSFDLFVCLVAIPLLLPVLAAVAVAVKLDSPGPILFRQDRFGLGNRKFRILKFRTMRVEQCDQDGDISTSRDDDRVTRIGGLLRRTSIDELPQLFNVLAGDMSIVGPRPHAEGSRAENMLFWDIDDRYWHRHSIKPGLTGLAQVRGFRGSTEAASDLSNRLTSDLEYVADWSLLLDIKILIKTFSVLTHRNAF